MSEKPFHHGNLRAVLLERAESMLRDEGADALSLRELARQAGVSHGAPRSHFVDRRALLDALAARGFERLTADLRTVLHSDSDFGQRFRRAARSYVDFAVRDAALMELMFSAKTTASSGPVHESALALFRTLDSMLETPSLRGDDRDRFKLLFAATMQGIATIVAAHRATPAQADQLFEDAVAGLLSSPFLDRRSVRPTGRSAGGLAEHGG